MIKFRTFMSVLNSASHTPNAQLYGWKFHVLPQTCHTAKMHHVPTDYFWYSNAMASMATFVLTHHPVYFSNQLGKKKRVPPPTIQVYNLIRTPIISL